MKTMTRSPSTIGTGVFFSATLLAANAFTTMNGIVGKPYDPFVGSGCDCEKFCSHECAINATKPQNMTFYRMTPHGVGGLNNMNTGDSYGDTSFVISRMCLRFTIAMPHENGQLINSCVTFLVGRTASYECKKDPTSWFCTSMTQFSGDNPNSTDLVIAMDVEVDGNWGPCVFPLPSIPPINVYLIPLRLTLGTFHCMNE
tara:strand:- start:167 stop:766 length:600 start_codon:yes stop_codon:yes gene_type:complete